MRISPNEWKITPRHFIENDLEIYETEASYYKQSESTKWQDSATPMNQ